MIQQNKYRVNELISRGGSSEIYSAIMTTDKNVQNELLYAIKKISAAQRHELAEKEKRITQRIENLCNYSIVIPILETWEDEENSYLVMQMKKNGKFLDEIIREIREEYHGVIPFAHVVGLMKAILVSLGRLHDSLKDTEYAQGYLHLDLHLGNIFFESIEWKENKYGVVKFIDLQTAQEIGKDGEIALDGIVGRTKLFSAPELVERDYEQLSVATDLYSVTSIFRTLLMEKNIDHLWAEEQIQVNEIREALEKNEGVPIIAEFIVKMIRCGLSYNPKYRFKSAEEMMVILENIERLQIFYSEKKYYELFRLAYQMNMKKECMSSEDFPFDAEEFVKAVTALQAALMTNQIYGHECYFIFHALDILMQGHSDEIRESTKAVLLSCGLASCNHISYSLKSIQLYERLEKVRGEIPFLEWAGIVNRIAVVFADVFQHEKALKLIRGNISDLERIKGVLAEISADTVKNNGGQSRLPVLARAYSAYGSYLAHENDSADPMCFFEKALTEFADDRGNRAITISHILHHAMEKRDFQLFEKYYAELSDGMSLTTSCILTKFIEERDSRKRNWFDLWVYLKAIYVFQKEDGIKDLKNDMIKLIKAFPVYQKRQHPEALILKYCGLLLYRMNGNNVDDSVRKAFHTAFQSLQMRVNNREGGTLNLTRITLYHLKSQYLSLCGEADEVRKLYEGFMEELDREKMPELEQWVRKSNKGRTIPIIDLKYEYH